MSIDEGTPSSIMARAGCKARCSSTQALAIERMPGLTHALNRFIAEAPARLASLIARPSGGAIEEVRATTLFQAIGECSGPDRGDLSKRRTRGAAYGRAR